MLISDFKAGQIFEFNVTCNNGEVLSGTMTVQKVTNKRVICTDNDGTQSRAYAPSYFTNKKDGRGDFKIHLKD